ncbi:MAG: hypothetical protein NC321_03965 [Clostridium sp.]|nr:hypothetical protein [Clostridium sp.]
MKKMINVIAVMVLIGSVYLYVTAFDFSKKNEPVSLGLQTESNEEEKSYSDTWIKEHVMGIEVGYNDYVTQNDIKQIGQMQNLKQLDIYISEEVEVDLSPLKNLMELEKLNIFIYGTVDLSFLENMSQLRELYIQVSNEPIDLSPLGSLVRLRKLEMTAILASSQDVSFLKNMNQLKEISIWKWCELEDLSVFSNMPYLQELIVSYVEDVDLNYLSECKNLERLKIIGGNIRNAKGLTDLVHLESLYLYDNSWDIEKSAFDLDSLSKMIGLKTIDLAYINVNDISPLAGLKCLRSILLVETGISDILPLKSLGRLESLYIYGNESEQVKEQAEEYFSELQCVEVTEHIPNGFLL